MAVGRISGQLLKANLLRDGVDIAFETDLLYLDVNNNRVGINNANPQYDIDVNGTTRTPTLEVTNFADIASINITGNTISTSGDTIVLGTTDNVIYQNRAVIDSINIENNTISTTDSNANIEFRPHGTGTVEVHSNMNVTGNIYATGNITADGEITIGDADTDFIRFNAEVNSNIIPTLDNTYSLGTDPTLGGNQWSDIYVENFFAGTIDTTGILVDGIDITRRQGNIYYVSENGDDTFTGDHPQDPFRSIKKGLETATAGDTVFITPGVYTEIFPMTVPNGVTLRGESLRSVTIQPTVGTQNNDAFYMQGESTVEEVTITGFYSPGYAFKFAPNFLVTSRSPYIRNITVITNGSVTSPTDVRGFDEGDAGQGAYLDGAVALAGSREASMLFHAVTFITPGVDAVTITNGTRVEWLNCFTYFANRGIYCVDGTTGLKGTGRTALRVDNLTGSIVAGNTVTYYDTDGVTVLGTGTISAKDGDDKFYILGKSLGFELPSRRTSKAVAVNGDVVLDTDQKKFGTASLLLTGQVGDFLSTQPQDDFGFATGNFTVEFFYRPDSGTATGKLIDFRAGFASDISPVIYIDNGEIRYYANGSDRIIGSTLTGLLWYHIALTRNANQTKLFVNGTQVGSTFTDGLDYGTTKPLIIGSNFNGSESASGHLDDLRISRSALYTANFTAPTTQAFNRASTVLMLRFNGDDSSVVITDEIIIQQDIRFSNGSTAKQFKLVDYTDFGAEVRMIGSASVYGNYGIYGDGPGVLVYAIGQNLAYIGVGKRSDNDPSLVVQDQEITELNGAKIRYNSVDHKGDFRVGELFYVNQETGEVTFTSSNLNVGAENGFTFTNGASTTFIDGTRIDTGNIRISGNTIETINGDLIVDSANNNVDFLNNVNINGDLDVTGNVTIGGNITIGDEVSDSIEFVAGIDSDIKPSQTSTYDLGRGDRVWKNLYANVLDIDDVRINNNYITTTTSNANLELRANGTGVIVIDDLSIDNISITSASNLNLNSATSYVKVNSTGSIKLPVGDTSQRPANESGIIRFNNQLNRFEGYDGSDWIQLNGVVDLDGDTNVTAELTQGANDNIIRFNVLGSTIVDINSVRLAAPRIVVDNIEIDTNVITTIAANSDLELRAQGTGAVRLEDLAFNNGEIRNVITDSITTFTNTGNGYVKINGTNGFVIPVGNNLNRPDPAFTETGMIRFNTVDGRIEAFDGNQWGSVAGATGAITTIDAGYLAVESVLHLG